VRRALEKERHWDLQKLRDVLQAARPDAVRSFLVFLHLLEREPEPVAELLLAHSEHQPAHPDPASHVFVNGVGDPLDHCFFHDTSTYTGPWRGAFLV
jgi:hypothetical protein